MRVEATVPQRSPENANYGLYQFEIGRFRDLPPQIVRELVADVERWFKKGWEVELFLACARLDSVGRQPIEKLINEGVTPESPSDVNFCFRLRGQRPNKSLKDFLTGNNRFQVTKILLDFGKGITDTPSRGYPSSLYLTKSPRIDAISAYRNAALVPAYGTPKNDPYKVYYVKAIEISDSHQILDLAKNDVALPRTPGIGNEFVYVKIVASNIITDLKNEETDAREARERLEERLKKPQK